uniref:Uncharacterized protein n=1 Tax=Varanus komodoensis TaxID=61221 RepID=A0A8D2IY00_VARKO
MVENIIFRARDRMHCTIFFCFYFAKVLVCLCLQPCIYCIVYIVMLLVNYKFLL